MLLFLPGTLCNQGCDIWKFIKASKAIYSYISIKEIQIVKDRQNLSQNFIIKYTEK